MKRRTKRLAAEAVFDLYRSLDGLPIGKDDLVDIYLVGYYQGCADTAVKIAKKQQPLLHRMKAKFVSLFVLPAEHSVKAFENDWRYH